MDDTPRIPSVDVVVNVTGGVPDPTADQLEHPEPAPPVHEPSEDPADENVAMDLDLAWPEPKRVEAWWAANQRRFVAGTRYLWGQPATPEVTRQLLVSGHQRARAAAADQLFHLQTHPARSSRCALPLGGNERR